MSQTSEGPADIASKRAHIGAFAALGPEFGMVGIRDMDQLEPVNLDRAGLEIDRLAVAGEIVGALAVDLDRRILRRHLRDRAGVARQQRLDRGAGRARLAHGRHAAVGIVGVALLAPAHGEAVGLAAVHDERDGLGRFAKRDWQAAGGERIERAGVSGALAREQPLDGADRLRRGHADRLVEHDPTMHVALLAAELLLSFFPRRLLRILPPPLWRRAGEGGELRVWRWRSGPPSRLALRGDLPRK